MAINYYSSINLNKNELQAAVIGNLGSAPGSPAEGQMYYDTGDNTIYFRDDSGWVDVGSSGDITGVTAGVGLSGGGSSGGVTLTLDLSELSAVTPVSGDWFATLDSDGANEQLTTTDALATLYAGAGMTASSAVLNVIGGNGITANANDVAVTAAQTTITSVYNTSLKLGRDSQNLIDFATTDNKIIFRVNNVNEMEMVANVLQPTTSDGIALGTGSLMWSDLFLASGAVVNFNNGDITATHSSNTLTIAGGTLATAALTTSTIVASGVVKTDDTTDATSTTDGSLQTDGGLSVAKDVIAGNDIYLLTDSAVLGLGAGKDATLTHDGTTGVTIAAAPISIDSTGTLDLSSTLGDINFQDGGTTQLAFDLDGTAGDVDINLKIDGDDLVFNQFDGTEVLRLSDDTSVTVATDLKVGDDLSLTSDSAVFNMGDGNDFTITHDGTTGVTLAGNPINITGGGASTWKTSAGAITVDSEASTVTVDGHTGINIVSSNSGEVDITSAAAVDINATTGITIDATTMSIDGDDDSNLTVTGSGKDLDIAVAGGGTQELRLASAGTGASALDLTTSAGGMDINSADMITVDAADEIVITTTSADGHISLVSAHTAGQAFHIDADANAGSIVDIDAGILDIDVTGVSTLDTTLLTMTSAGGLTIKDTTTSSATEGGHLILASDDGAVMADNHRLGVIEFKGAEDTSNTLTTGARIQAIADAAWSGTENGASLQFYTTDANAAQGVALTLDSDQKATFAADVAVAGDLTVAGTTTTQNTVLIENTVTTLVFEGATADAHETTIKVVEPTADTSFSFPALSAGNFFLPAIADTASDASSAVTAAEFALLDGGSTVGTTAVANGDGIVTNDGGTMRQTTVQTFQTYFDANTVGGTGIVTTGALDAGSITSNFGTIDTGSSAITTTGLISGGSLDIDDVLINGTTIGHTDDTDLMTLADGVLTVAGELDAASLDISGNADIDGTLETDALTIDGTAIIAQATLIAVGGVELATGAEVITATDAARAVTPATLADKSVVTTIAQSSLTDDLRATITHSLGTADTVVQLYDMTTEAVIYADIGRTTDDMSTASTSVITVDFGTTPPNDVRCVITSMAGATAGSIAYT